MANNFNIGEIMANWQATPTMPGASNLNVGFPGVTGTQSVPGAQPGFLDQGNRLEMIAMALDQLGGIVNPFQKAEGLGTGLAKSRIASKAFQTRQGMLTPQDQEGETSVVRKAGPGGTIIETTTRTLPRDDSPGDALQRFP